MRTVAAVPTVCRREVQMRTATGDTMLEERWDTMLSWGSTQCWTEKRDTMPDVGRTQCCKGKQDTIAAVEGTQGLLWEGQTMLDRRGTQCVIERGHNAGERWETKMSEQFHTSRPFARDGNSDHPGRYYLQICTDGVELSGMTTSNFQIIPETSRSFRSMTQLYSSEQRSSAHKRQSKETNGNVDFGFAQTFCIP